LLIKGTTTIAKAFVVVLLDVDGGLELVTVRLRLFLVRAILFPSIQ